MSGITGDKNQDFIRVDKNNQSFNTVISHNYCDNSTWPSVTDSQWIVEPSAVTKFLELSRAEIQFTHDIKFKSSTTPKEFYYDVWLYNPLFDDQLTVDADDPTFVPGVSSGNPLRFLYKRYIYKSLMDVFNYGNNHYSMPFSVDGLASGVTTIQFNYDQIIVLDGSQGTQIRFSIEDNVQMESGAGESFFTISTVIREHDL